VSEYLVIYEQAQDGGWGAYLPDLPGVVALGKTRDEAMRRIEEALLAYADELREHGSQLPEPLHEAGTVRV
jgi:predicted RNase H-like HicB family nuclease